MRCSVLKGLLGLVVLLSGAWAQAAIWQEYELPDTASREYGRHYLVHLPKGYAEDKNKAWPLIVFLHGRGMWGDDLAKVKREGLAQYIDEGKEIAAIVLAPQSPQSQYWHPLFVDAVMQDAASRYRIDRSRVYITGLSMGGMGSWNMAIAFPGRFAAMAPISASLINDAYMDSLGQELGEPALFKPFLSRLRDLPTWVFHGDRDTIVATELGKRSARLLQEAGGTARTTIYPMTDHDGWTQTYFDNPEFYRWLFAQSKAGASWEESRPAVRTGSYVGNYVDAGGAVRAVVSEKGGRLYLKWMSEEKAEELIAIDTHHFVGSSLVHFEGEPGGHMQTLIYTGDQALNYRPD